MKSCAHCSSDSAPTAPWAPTRSRSRSSAKTRTNYCARILRLRFEESGRDDDLASALRAASDSLDLSHQRGAISLPAISRFFSNASTFCEASRLAEPFCSTRPIEPQRKSGSICLKASAAAHRERRRASSSSTRNKVARDCRTWAGASTRSCRPVSSRFPACCHRSKPSRRSRTRSGRPTAKKGEEIVRDEPARRSIKRSPTCTK